MIASVAFHNFKALRMAQLKLMPCNLVLGPNGSGKTSLIEALLRLRDLSSHSPVSGRPSPSTDAGSASRGGLEIVFGFNAPNEAITVRMSCRSELVCDLLQVEPHDSPGWPALRASLKHIRGYAFDPPAMGAPVPENEGSELAPNGSNLAAVMAAMKEKSPEAFAVLSADLCRIMPEFSGVDLVRNADGRIGLGLGLVGESQRVTAENLSQGTRHLLALLTLAHQPEPPSVVCIEEVDRGIHPRMLREVRDLLYRMSYPSSFGMNRQPVQVVATTHSPYLLDFFRDHPEEIVISHKVGTAAHFERLADRADLPELLREGSLGDIWLSGILGGVPEE